MSPMVVKAFKIRKRYLAALVVLVFLSFFLSRVIEARADRRSVTVMSWSVANKVIVVDPGHGGIDPGVVGKSGALEKDITLAVGKRLAANLGQAGAMVLMTRETDTDLSDPGTVGVMAKKREDLKRRVALANDHKADLYVSIHVNSFPSSDRRGAQTFIQPGSAESKKAAHCIQAEMSKVLKDTERLTNEVDFFITRNTSMPTVIAEIGFMTNETEEKLLQDPAYQGKVAWAVYAGVVKYFAQSSGDSGIQPGKEKTINTFKQQAPIDIKEP